MIVCVVCDEGVSEREREREREKRDREREEREREKGKVTEGFHLLTLEWIYR